jgi:hypothetical protein
MAEFRSGFFDRERDQLTASMGSMEVQRPATDPMREVKKGCPMGLASQFAAPWGSLPIREPKAASKNFL